jgi:tRNA(fMet)-specific endonuclease VapC
LSLRYLLDTSTISETLKPSPHRGLLRRLGEHRAEVATAAPVWHELVFGCRRLPPSPRREALEDYLYGILAPSLAVLPYDMEAAARHGEERARLAAGGKTPPFVDGQIAAVALVQGLILVTRNVTDFTEFAGLEIENWMS